ncbi:E3 ubiquitin-protein ligase RNF128-like [Danio aesculapii]|uniref:E3 ubiquitin-protein ligase RNF128-like n=1 Tax=Danio aesculapii TaxID=1142201 RepID=UPI0024C0058F|nr:E3 ubiquitin-protein ligase RNF128-like [Danio aesculapii]
MPGPVTLPLSHSGLDWASSGLLLGKARACRIPWSKGFNLGLKVFMLKESGVGQWQTCRIWASCRRDVFSWLLLASVLQVSSVRLAEASYLCTAYLNISYTNPETNKSTWFQEEMGLYGQDSPKAYVKGNVYLASPIYGCDDDTVYGRPNGSKGWIALIQRGNGCTFTEKNIAAMNGAAAAIIFNDFGSENRVIQMSHPGTTIVAVMIGNFRGMELVQLLDQGVPVAIAIEVGKQHGPWMSHYSVFFVSISFFIVTAATVGYFIFYSARRLNSLRQQNRQKFIKQNKDHRQQS